MSTTKLSRFTRLRDPPSPFPLPESAKQDISPAYYWNEENHKHTLFILDETNKNLIEYDLDRQETINKYPAPIDPSNIICIFINPSAKVIYVVDCYDSTIFDIRTRKWSCSYPHNFEKEISRTGFPNIIYLPVPNDCLHVIAESKHYPKWFPLNYNKSPNITLKDVDRGKLVYIDKKIMLFPEYREKILFCNLINERTYNWTEYDVKPPKVIQYCKWFDVIIGWDQLIFYFDHAAKTVHCLDSLHLDLKWMEVNGCYGEIFNCCLPEMYIGADHVIKDNDNRIHLLTLYDYDERDDHETCCFHLIGHLLDLIPPKVTKANQNDMDPLIIGYCKKYEKANKAYIPHYLRKLIVQFYPVFA